MSHRSNFPPVYPDLNSNPDEVFRGNPKLLASDVRLIISVVGNTSIITHICQHAIKHAAEYCRSNDLTLADYDRFVEYLRQRSLAVPSATAPSASDVSGRTAGRSEQIARAANKLSKPRKNVKG